jgi:hypothetical protein
VLFAQYRSALWIRYFVPLHHAIIIPVVEVRDTIMCAVAVVSAATTTTTTTTRLVADVAASVASAATTAVDTNNILSTDEEITVSCRHQIQQTE